MTAAKRSWLALLPASKGTRPGGDGPAWSTVASPAAREVTEAVRSAARDLGDAAFGKLVEAPASKVDHARALALGIADAPTLPGWQRYEGVVHTSADPGSLSSADRSRFRRHVAYVSALSGLVLADEPLPEYRLPMAASLDGMTDDRALAAHWRPIVRERLADVLAPGARVWLLTGGEYERAVDLPDQVAGVSLTFVERRPPRKGAAGKRDGTDGSPPAAALKQARGLLARLLASTPGAGRAPDGSAWEGVTFHAGLRDFHLEDATPTSQTWRAIPT